MLARTLLLAGVLSLGCASSPPPSAPPPAPPAGPRRPRRLPAPPPAPSACGALDCRLYDTPLLAFRAVLAQKPLVLALGEAHGQKDTPGVPTSARRFTEEMLPELQGQASDLVIELMVPPAGCEKKTKAAVRKKLEKVTEHQAETNQNEYVTLGHAAEKFGIAPHLLFPSCADFKAVDAAGADSVDAALQLVGRLMRETADKLLARNEKAGADRMIVLYGGALHNDVSPEESARPYAFGPPLVAATRDRYVELDVFVPELIRDTGMWTRFPWYPHFDKKAHPDSATLFRPLPASFTAAACRRRRRSPRLEERGPLVEAVGRAEEDLRGRRPAGGAWHAEEAHHRLLRGLPAFPQVAVAAGGHQVLPGVGAAAGAGHDVVDVEVAHRGPAAAVLALVGVAEHHVLAGEPDHRAADALVAAEVQHPRHAERAAHHREPVVVGAHRQRAPGAEVVHLAQLVDGQRGAAEEEQESTAGAGDLDRLEEAVDHQDREAQRIDPAGAVAGARRRGMEHGDGTPPRWRGPSA